MPPVCQYGVPKQVWYQRTVDEIHGFSFQHRCVGILLTAEEVFLVLLGDVALGNARRQRSVDARQRR